MRRVTAKQLAAMITASTGLVSSGGLTVAGLRTSLMALTPVLLVSHEALAQSDDELPQLQEVVVTATAIYDYADINEDAPIVRLDIGYEETGPADGAPLDTSPSLRPAVRCALKYSGLANRVYGNAPGYNTQVNSTEWGWGTSNPAYPATISTTSETTPPIPLVGYTLIDGNTSGGKKTSTVWVLNNARDANLQNVSLQTELVDTLAHEWYHEWNPTATEDQAKAAGAAARAAYLKGGGDAQNCSH